ncbi:transcriptional regulator [Sporanaerobium hydrogeniformans]|uniref:Transcriptional regulator n=1 Tax=Sporanaerobium hydrogeniformans TaxID=3072179 RepID=A0AC61DBB2_9FIRM|nr:metalloregulator ArsR/SmtB family transcription factor [Sporanaerobium hydrogeniformans]PHV70564.1 transcriptional regulator [Sporanaerobium hydrogeniformans]
MTTKYSDNAKIFKAFCDESRFNILESLQTGEKCACVLLENLHISQSTLSHHMKILVESGIVESRKEGKWTYYFICDSGVTTAKMILDKITKVHSTSKCEEIYKCK